MRSDTLRPLVRALTLPSVLFTTGLAGHTAGGGLIPTASVLVSLFVLTVVAVVPFARSPLRPATTLALLIGGQGLLHAAFQLLSGPAVTAQTVMPGGAMTMSSSTSSCHSIVHSGTASHGLMPAMSGGHFVMVLGHLAAAAAVGVWLAAGERALWMLLALATRPVLDAWRMVAAVAGGLHQAVHSRRQLFPGWSRPSAVGGSVWCIGGVSHRGPPNCCVA
jgi:hypothetical protein